jgi:hypothetical protein
MKAVVCCLCPDTKQRAHLRLVWPSWQDYAKRHSLPIRAISDPPVREHMYWGKYFLLDLPELREYDTALVLDNDILISANAPSVLADWNPEFVGMVDERAQFGWDDEDVRRYYEDYGIAIGPKAAEMKILNGGVLVYGRQHVDLFRQTYESWLQSRSTAREAVNWRMTFLLANDQPHVGLALQQAGTSQLLDPRFNRLWWSWWLNDQQRAEWPFKIYAKASKMLTPFLPRFLTDPIAAPGLRAINRALRENFFLHFAGSKSPFHLLAHRGDYDLSTSPGKQFGAQD